MKPFFPFGLQIGDQAAVLVLRFELAFQRQTPRVQAFDSFHKDLAIEQAGIAGRLMVDRGRSDVALEQAEHRLVIAGFDVLNCTVQLAYSGEMVRMR